MIEILSYFPRDIQEKLQNYQLENLEEIRIRNQCPMFLKIGAEEVKIDCTPNTESILKILQRICDNSIYTYQNQICNGYITVRGGHRIGLTGNVVLNEGKVSNISHIYSLNFRIARQILNCSNKILPYVINSKMKCTYNTILLSPPGRGKTTLLRDLIRRLSNGVPEYDLSGMNIGVVDERGEIAGMYKGVPQNDVGSRTDILDNVPKSVGMKMLIRSMNPKIVTADEIGTKEDVEAIKYAICSGVKGIFTAHGDVLEDIILNPILKELYEIGIVERILHIQEDREVQLIYKKEDKNVCY